MNETLPSAIESYFSGKNARDFAMAASGFSSSAVVKDEGRDHQGPDAIRTWIEATTAKYDDRAEVRAVSSNGANVDVTAEIRGKFPGSPIVLRFKFTLDERPDQSLGNRSVTCCIPGRSKRALKLRERLDPTLYFPYDEPPQPVSNFYGRSG